ncbi:MAG: N-acetyltransferase [Bacteroidetes bacterium]|nr:MAG: N-acetyltransferase [Bacteroidota bacterium]
MSIRLANINEAEIARINDIYNESAAKRFLTADIEPTTLTDRIRWLLSYNQTDYPVYVAVQNYQVVGWISVRPYREGRAALKFTKELSYYVAEDWRSKGIGSQLLQHVIDQAPQLKIKNLIAIVLEKNITSISLLEKFKFNRWGFLPSVADFDGETCGHLYFGLGIPEKPKNERRHSEREELLGYEI